MNRFLTNAEWARAILGGVSELGDTRRTDRLVRMASSFADAAGASPARASASPADAEGAYRLLRNDEVDADAITEAGCAATAAALASSGRTLLAIEDTTTLSYRHSVADAAGEIWGAGRTPSGEDFSFTRRWRWTPRRVRRWGSWISGTGCVRPANGDSVTSARSVPMNRRKASSGKRRPSGLGRFWVKS